jgi:hypothetical protein
MMHIIQLLKKKANSLIILIIKDSSVIKNNTIIKHEI